ncbi:putative uncharacterized protein DDB_G0282133 [Daktulosphaira vitifoliae]|uniref:putative uncharacterized protein DDB_G0282133 n=1 Tax=Daktulosphaira vitifoliae TaxID=58002 RepID=UPI0021A9D4CF|nr:putative uncharacterized protein DDB_G0282133 [Daktulosphaira vitifoliae]
MAILKYGIFIFLLPEIFAASLYQYGQPFTGFFSNQRQPSSQWLNPFFSTQNNGLQNRQQNDLFNSNSFFQQIPFVNFLSQKPFDETNTVRLKFDERDQQFQPPSSQHQQESTLSEVKRQLEDVDLLQLFNIINNQPRNDPNHQSMLPPHLLAQQQSTVNHQKSESYPQQNQNNSTNLEQVSPLKLIMQMPFMNTELPNDSNQKNIYKNEKKPLSLRMNKKNNMPEKVNLEKYENQRDNSVDESQYNINKNEIISLLSNILGSQDISGFKTTETEPIQMNAYKQNVHTPGKKLNEESDKQENYYRSELNDQYNTNKDADKQNFNEKMDSMNNNTSTEKEILSFLSNILGSQNMSTRPPFMINIPREEKEIQRDIPKKLINSIKEQSELKNDEKKGSQIEPIQMSNIENDQISNENVQKKTEKQQNNQLEQNIHNDLNENATNKNDINKLMKLIKNSPNSEAIMSLLTKILGSGDMSSQLPFLMDTPREENNNQQNSQRETMPLEKPSNSFESNKNQIELQDNKSSLSKLNDQSSNNHNNNNNEYTNPKYNNEHINRLETQIEKPPIAESNIVQSQPQNNQSNKITVQQALSKISDTVKLNLNGVKAIYEFISSNFTNSNITEKLRLTLDISQAVLRGFQKTLELNKKILHEKHQRPNYNSSYDGMNMSNFSHREFDNDSQIFDNIADTMRSFGMPNFIGNSRNNMGFNSDAAQFEALLNNSFGNIFDDFGFNTNRRNNFADQQIFANILQPLFEEVTKVLLENPPVPYNDNSQNIKKFVPELMKVIKNTFTKEIDDITHGNQPDVSSS